MIKTYHYPDSGSPIVITIHARILSADKFFNSVQTDRESAEKWIAKQYRNLYAETILHFIHHRRAAYRAFQNPMPAYAQALDQLEFRFEKAHSTSLPELVKRVHLSKELLITILPPSDSYWKNWRETIQDLIEECDKHYFSYLSNNQYYERISTKS